MSQRNIKLDIFWQVSQTFMISIYSTTTLYDTNQTFFECSTRSQE